MTYTEIITIEDTNTDKVYLHRAGAFLNVFEHSAFLCHQYVYPFKLHRKFVKSINRHIIYLGIPEASLKKWFYSFPIHELSDRLLICDIGKTFDEVSYQNWCECAIVESQDSERYTVHTAIIEKTDVYKTAYDLLIGILQFSRHVDKNLREPLSNNAKNFAYELCYQVRILFDAPKREDVIDCAQSLCKQLSFTLQVLKDMKQISARSFASSNERIMSVSRQLEGLRRTAPAPRGAS